MRVVVTQGDGPVWLPRLCSSVAAVAEVPVSLLSSQVPSSGQGLQWGLCKTHHLVRASPGYAAPGWIPSILSSLVFLEIPEATVVTSSFLLKSASMILSSEIRNQIQCSYSKSYSMILGFVII